jgi:hypothetical protein
LANQNFRVKNGLEVGTGVTISGGIVTATTFSGNATSSNYAITAGITTYSSISGISTSVIGGIGNISQLQVSGVSTFQSSVFLGDGDILYFGDGEDLLIWHNSTDSIIRDNGTGDLLIEGGNRIKLTNPTGTETYGVFNQDGAVELYYDNVKKFETTGAGVSISGGQIYLNASGSNRIDFNTDGVNPPSFTTRSTGTKVVLYPSISGSSVDYSLGIAPGVLWNSVPAYDAGMYFKWFGGETEIASLSGTGNLTATSLIKSGGTSSQFLKADGSVDSSTYLTSYTETDTLNSVTNRGNSTSNGISVGIITATTFNGPLTGNVTGNISAAGVSTFTNGPVFIGTGTSTGTASQTLQVTGGAYVSGNLGIGTTNPTEKLEVVGTVKATSLVKSGGTSSQFLKADGSVDSSTYLTSYSETDTLNTVTNRGNSTSNGISVGVITATSIVKSGGTSSQFLKADGSVDSSTYLTSYTETDTLNSVTNRGNSTSNGISVGIITATSVSDSSGNVRAIPQNSQTSAYILAIGDVGKHISITTGGVTVNSGIFSAGDGISIYNNSGSNQTITQGGSVTMYLAGTATTGNRTLAQRGVCTVLCVASNTFAIFGAGLT